MPDKASQEEDGGSKMRKVKVATQKRMRENTSGLKLRRVEGKHDVNEKQDFHKLAMTTALKHLGPDV